jgi:hypothetical protein
MESDHLRVLIANERRDRLELVAAAVVALGHEVIAREIKVNDVGALTAHTLARPSDLDGGSLADRPGPWWPHST